ncbi:hypothetical protein ACNFB1_16575 [Pseudomonas sp. NY15349]|uniref:hypothetical protein n=1 Tax=Pseudomonas sp. NY15349 TaxID=3400350 RepID=UPI003A8A37D1
MAQGNFFAIGAKEFVHACSIGINSAVALLVMARGSGRDNATTSWSALSIFTRTGMARRRAQLAIESLIGAGLVEVLQAGKRPRYKLHKPADDAELLWLPNELIDGAGAEIPPVTKLREAGNIELLQKLIELYGVQDLDNDGGLPRTLVWSHFERSAICPVGLFTLYGFRNETCRAAATGLFADYANREDERGNRGAWVVLSPLRDLGLIERFWYMAESQHPDAELIYPVGPHGTGDAMYDLIQWLEDTGGKGYAFEAQTHDALGIAMKHIENANLVGLYRLRYRPKTGKTSRWWALELQQAEAMVEMVRQQCSGEKVRPVHIKAFQG